MKKILAYALALMPMVINAQANGFDSDWIFWSEKNPQKVTVSIPHDAMQTEERSDTLKGGRHNGFFPGGVYHYEKQLQVPREWLSKHVTIHFEGVYQQSTVSINGKKAGGMVYGYLPFDVCADGLLREGVNTIRVDVDNSQVANSRWYTGAGIYRPVRLQVQETQYIKEVRAQTRDVSDERAIVNVVTQKHGGENVRVSLLWKGETVATGLGTNVNLTVKNAHLWSDVEPNLYQVKVELLKDGETIDQEVKNFGIRTLQWTDTEGLLVNGKPTLLRGGCLHHDNGILGAREYRDAVYRKLKMMKEEYGFNAIRSSHNPCSETMLEVCDELGIYVMDELWDMWYFKKTPYDYAHLWEQYHEHDIEAMVRKDYSHPSVIMYSIGNEVTEPAEERGVETARRLVESLHRMDPSRPVTAGINLTLLYLKSMGINMTGGGGNPQQQQMSSEEYNKMVNSAGPRMMQATLRPQVDSLTTPVLDCLDIAGYNYASPRYEIEGQAHPSRIVVGSETYYWQLADCWEQVERLPWLIGDFMWTAWDYIGEVSVGAWYNTTESPSAYTQQYPCLLGGVGAIDLIGHPTGEALRTKAIWQRDGKPYMAVRPVSKLPLIKSAWRATNSIPSWSWQGEEGTPATVEVFTSAPSVKLFLNDRMIGEKSTDKCVATFELRYKPGTLRAVTDNGECILRSAKGKLQISAQAERSDYKPSDLIYLNIDLTDKDGHIESNADQKLQVQVEDAELLAFGSANPRTVDRFHTGRYTTYYGRSQAILRAEKPGKVTVTIKGKGLKTLKKVITVD